MRICAEEWWSVLLWRYFIKLRPVCTLIYVGHFSRYCSKAAPSTPAQLHLYSYHQPLPLPHPQTPLPTGPSPCGTSMCLHEIKTSVEKQKGWGEKARRTGKGQGLNSSLDSSNALWEGSANGCTLSPTLGCLFKMADTDFHKLNVMLLRTVEQK